jgi:hypothetical protein
MKPPVISPRLLATLPLDVQTKLFRAFDLIREITELEMRIDGLRYTPKQLRAQRKEEFEAEKKATIEEYNGLATEVNAYFDSPKQA